MLVRIAPDRHAYYAGDTLRVRIDFDPQENRPDGASKKGTSGKALPRQRLGLIGLPSHVKETQPPYSGYEGRNTELETDISRQPIAPIPSAAQIPHHHPHARKASIAQVPTMPTPTEALGGPRTREEGGEEDREEGGEGSRGTATPITPRFRSSLAPISESHASHSSAPVPPSPATTRVSNDDALITFATIQMTGHMVPSPAYIPPEPLIPLRNLLLLQPIGSSDASPLAPPSPSLSSPSTFSPTSAIDHAAAAVAAADTTLTASLTSLARGIFNPAAALAAAQEKGTWEDHRKRVWLARELPVWISPRDVVCVDKRVGKTGGVSYTYDVPIPGHLPPTFKGKSLSFGYTLRLSLAVTFPSSSLTSSSWDEEKQQEEKPSSSSWRLFSAARSLRGKETASPSPPPPPITPLRVVQRELVVPVRVLPRVTVPPTSESYDILLPSIPRVGNGIVSPVTTHSAAGVASSKIAEKDGEEEGASAPIKRHQEPSSEAGEKKESEEAEMARNRLLIDFVEETLWELQGDLGHGNEREDQAEGDQAEEVEMTTATTTTTVATATIAAGTREEQGKIISPGAVTGESQADNENKHSHEDKQEEGKGNEEIGTEDRRFEKGDSLRRHDDDGDIGKTNGDLTTSKAAADTVGRTPTSSRSPARLGDRLSGTEAIQALIRSSRPGRFEIVKRHQQIAVLCLPRVAWRTGEAVSGVITFHHPASRFDVLKLSIDLITTETIPPPLLPIPANHSAPSQPLLQRTIAQHGNAYTLDLARTGFALDIPGDATPTFQVCAGNAAEETGGLGWGLHLRFLVRTRTSDRRGKQAGEGRRDEGRVDELGYQRSGMTGELVPEGKPPDTELDVDIVECTIPLTVYPNDQGKTHVREFRL